MKIRNKERISSRSDEIINACALLYQAKSFKDITLLDIAKETSFTRTSIYNYFHSKEEIFLALLEREYRYWVKDLHDILQSYSTLDLCHFADLIASSLNKRILLLKLLAMNHYDMEENSRLENLIAFKKAYKEALLIMEQLIHKFFPAATIEDINSFIYSFFPFIFGIYPYCYTTTKQIEAMKLADVHYLIYSIHDLVYQTTCLLLDKFKD